MVLVSLVQPETTLSTEKLVKTSLGIGDVSAVRWHLKVACSISGELTGQL